MEKPKHPLSDYKFSHWVDRKAHFRNSAGNIQTMGLDELKETMKTYTDRGTESKYAYDKDFDEQVMAAYGDLVISRSLG